MIESINIVLSTLNRIEVHGKSNLDMLLGCIMTLEQCKKELENKDVTDNG